MKNSLKDRAVKGVLWSSAERFSVQGIQVIITLILANILDPSDFGLIAVLGVFIAVSQTFIDSGFSNAIIQKKDRSEVDFSTAFYFNLVVSLCIYLILFFLAPVIASFFDEPQLTSITRYISLNLIIFAFTVIQKTKLTIKLDFKTQAKASLFSVISGGVLGIFAAFRGYGVFSLVIQQISTNLIQAIILWIITKWSPGFHFSTLSFKHLFRYGSKLLATGLLSTIYQNLYTFIIGLKFSASQVGYFNQASRLSQFPSINLSSILTRAMFPVLSELQDDKKRLEETFDQYLRLSVFIIFPLMCGLATLADPFIRTLLNDNWLPAIPFIRILAIAFMWYPISGINNLILMVKGRTDYSLKSEIIKKVCAFTILFGSIPFGLTIITFGLILYNLIDVIISAHFASKVIDTGILSQIRAYSGSLLSSLLMSGMVLLITYAGMSPLLTLIIGTISGLAVYLALARLLKMKELPLLISFIKSL